jgi:hypothetical protein
LYVNGGLVYSGYNGAFDPDFNTGPNDRTSELLFFGSTSSNGPAGQANYNLVKFEILPGPSTALLASVGALAFIKRRRTKGSRLD